MSKRPVNAASRVYGNPTKYGYLLGSNSPLSENSQTRMMKDLIHKGQSDFLEHPVTRAWINTMTFVATGGIEGAVGIGKLGWSLFSRRAAKTTTQTVYRVFGGEANALGKSWTPVNPGSVTNYRNAAGLPNVNTGQFIIEGTVKNSNILLKRRALPLNGNTGGIMEYIIKDPTKIEINGVWGVNPPF